MLSDGKALRRGNRDRLNLLALPQLTKARSVHPAAERIAAAGPRVIIFANLRDANQITDAIRRQCVQADQQAMGGCAFGMDVREKRPRG